MKKKSILKKFIVLLTLLTPTIINAKEYIVCGNNKKFPTVIGTIVSTIYVIIKIIVPLLLVISGIISFLKATVSGNVDDSLDKAKKKFITNILAAVIIFFIVSIVNFIINISVGTESELKNCVYCIIHPEKCEQIDSETATLCPGLLSEQHKYDSNCNLKDEYKNDEKIDYANTGDTGVPAYTNTIASAGGGAIARTIIDNPNALTNQNIIAKSYINDYSYYLYVPKKIDGNKAALIVYLHGTGGTGGGYETLKADGGGGFLHEIEDKKVEYNCYILIAHAPKIASSQGWSAADVMGIINQEIQNPNNNIDTKRISIWGYSLGAEIIPTLVNNNPTYFSSAVLIAKKGITNVQGFKTVPTYGFYGASDGYANGKRYPGTGIPVFINKLKNAGYTAYVREYPAPQDHAFMPNVVLEDTNIGNGFTTIIDWVLSQRRTD